MVVEQTCGCHQQARPLLTQSGHPITKKAAPNIRCGPARLDKISPNRERTSTHVACTPRSDLDDNDGPSRRKRRF